MSRVGKAPIPLPQGVKAQINGNHIQVEGPKGKLSRSIHSNILVEVKPEEIQLQKKTDDPQAGAYYGLFRALIANMVTGVSEGFRKNLEIVGVGYRAEVKGKDLVLTIGFSHPVTFTAPEGITFKLRSE